jgi:site-specific DNA-methyltransferase (adenine-specific)
MMQIEDLKNRIVLGNCVELLRDIPDESVDLAFADPPFNLKKNYGVCNDKMGKEEYLAWSESWLKEMVRIIKPTGSVIIHHFPDWLIHYSAILNQYASFKHWIAWDAISSPYGKKLYPAHYGFLHYEKVSKSSKFYDTRHPHKRCTVCKETTKRYGGKKHNMHQFGALVSDVWTDIPRINNNKNRKEGHPCQLPLPVMDRLILMTTDAGDVVIDPFMGLGTTALSAKQLGRNYIGFDIDAEYVAVAQDSLCIIRETKLGEIFVSRTANKIWTIRDADWEELSSNFTPSENVEKIEVKLIS